MTTINAEKLLKVLAITPGNIGINELFPYAESYTTIARVETSQTAWRAVWVGNDMYTFSSVPENMYVSSSSTLDVGRIIFVAGLDEQFNVINGWGITNGQTQSIVTSLPGAGVPVEFYRVNISLDYTLSLTTPNLANGNIYIAASDAAPGGIPAIEKTRGIIELGESQYLGSISTMPAGKVAYMGNTFFSQNGDKQIRVRLRLKRSFFQGATRLYVPEIYSEVSSVAPGISSIDSKPPILSIPGGTDVWFEAIGTSPVSGTLTVLQNWSLVDLTILKPGGSTIGGFS